MAEPTPPSELKVPSRRRRKTRASRACRRERAQNRAQGLPCRLIQSRIGGHEFPNHIVCRHIQGAFRRRPHGQGNRALRAKTDPLCRRLLPRLDPNGLREQIHGYGFLSALNRAIAAQTVHVFQAILLVAGCRLMRSCERSILSFPGIGAQVCRKIPGNRVSEQRSTVAIENQAVI